VRRLGPKVPRPLLPAVGAFRPFDDLGVLPVARRRVLQFTE